MPLSKLRKFASTKRKKVSAAIYRPWNEIEWEGIGALSAAGLVVNKAVGTRKSDQQFNVIGVLGSVFIVGITLTLWIYLATGGTRGGLSGKDFVATRLVQQSGLVFPTAVETVQEAIYQLTGTATTIVIQPTYTYYPTYTIQPTVTVQKVVAEPFYYSRYDPGLLDPKVDLNSDGSCKNVEGGICHTVNCWDYDLVEGECRSMMTTGLDWRDYFGRSVACGDEYPLYTIFRVVAPLQVAGDYECLDRCPACTGKKILDFLETSWELTWLYPLSVEVIYR